MATLGNTYPDLVDMYRRTNPDGSSADIIELLKVFNPVLEDAIALECNKGASHQHTIRTGLPPVSWGSLYGGIPQGKSNVQQVTDTTGFVEGLSSVDTRVLALAKNPDYLRSSEASSFLEAMNNEVASGIFYHDTATTPNKFKGLSARYNTLGGPGAGNQVVNGGGAGSDNTSIWFVTWGERYTHLLYPEGTQAGLTQEDMGRQRVTDSSGDAYFVEEERFEWHVGMAVRDWRYNARIANIDVSSLATNSVALYDFMRNAFYKLQSRMRRGGAANGRQAIYCNRNVLESLDAISTNAGASDNFIRLKPMEVEGKEIPSYRGIPIRETDALLNTEALVS